MNYEVFLFGVVLFLNLLYILYVRSFFNIFIIKNA